jgi:sterol 24-C-methyltransferase
VKKIGYQAKQAYDAVKELWEIPDEDFDAFLKSFEVFERSEAGSLYVNATEDFKSVRAYYSVLNKLCTLGDVEKMYIPAIIDATKGTYDNQMISEEWWADHLNLKPGKQALELGCGRGRITHHIASYTGANVIGLNIDPVQIKTAEKYAAEQGMSEQTKFMLANMNDPFPFENESFDAFYQVQAMTYAESLEGVFGEIYRVLKPGARMHIVDGVMLDGFNAEDPEHKRLLRETREVTGWGGLWHHSEWKKSIEAAGFEVIWSKDPSYSPDREGSQALLIEQTGRYFWALAAAVKLGSKIGLIPHHLDILMERLNRHGESYIEMDKRNMLTTSWDILAQKPVN